MLQPAAQADPGSDKIRQQDVVHALHPVAVPSQSVPEPQPDPDEGKELRAGIRPAHHEMSVGNPFHESPGAKAHRKNLRKKPEPGPFPDPARTAGTARRHDAMPLQEDSTADDPDSVTEISPSGADDSPDRRLFRGETRGERTCRRNSPDGRILSGKVFPPIAEGANNPASPPVNGLSPPPPWDSLAGFFFRRENRAAPMAPLRDRSLAPAQPKPSIRVSTPINPIGGSRRTSDRPLHPALPGTPHCRLMRLQSRLRARLPRRPAASTAPAMKSRFSPLGRLVLLLACSATAIYYAIMLQPSMHGTVLGRYTTKNPVDYAITFLFLWSLIDLAMKCLAFPGEMLSPRHEWLPERNGQQPVSDAAALIPKESELSGWQLRSRICSRITKALQYAVEHGVGQDYRDQIKYLSGKAEEETLARYSVVRFAIAITPMLGFLGTVVHFGTALSGISFEEMDSRLADVVSHMGEAFNTTTSALAAAMTAMFFLFLAERTDKGIDAAVDRYVERELETRFVAERKIAPELDGVQSAHDDALLIMRQTLERQVQLWTEALGGLFQQFEQRQAAEGGGLGTGPGVAPRGTQDSFEQRKKSG